VLSSHCVRGITADTERLARTVAESIGLVTALCPMLGYETATAIAQEPCPAAGEASTSF
jgi:aspartate ammonia-lyase